MIEADVLTSLKYNYDKNCGFGSAFGQPCLVKSEFVRERRNRNEKFREKGEKEKNENKFKTDNTTIRFANTKRCCKCI